MEQGVFLYGLGRLLEVSYSCLVLN